MLRASCNSIHRLLCHSLVRSVILFSKAHSDLLGGGDLTQELIFKKQNLT